MRRLLILTMTMLGLTNGIAMESLSELLKAASTKKVYEPIAADERRQAQTLFMRSFREGSSPGLVNAWAALGMTLSRKGSFLCLQESAGQERGRGWFLLQSGRKNPLALQCPHSFKDLHTRKIALAWMLDGDFGSAAFNTVPREFTNEDGDVVAADMGKEGSTYFMAFTVAWARVHREGCILQMHGFATEKRTSPEGKAADVVLSSGVKDPTSKVLALASDLTAKTSARVSVYGRDVRELGGTTNVQALGLRYEGFKDFVHLELCREQRDRLVKDATYRGVWLECLHRHFGKGVSQ